MFRSVVIFNPGKNSPPPRWRDAVIRQSTQAQKDLCFEFSHAEWLESRPDVPFALMRGNYGGYVDNIAESYLRHCWVQVMMNVQNRVKEYLVNELSKVPAFRILKRARVVNIWIEAIDNKVLRVLDLNDMVQLVNIGDRHRITQGFCDSVNRIYSEFYPRVANLPGTRILTGRNGHFQPNWHRCLRLMHFLQQYNYANGLVHFNVVPDVKLRPFHIKLTKDLSRSSRLFGPTAPESVERFHNILTVPQYIQNRVETTRFTDLQVVSPSWHVTSLLYCLLCIWFVLKSVKLNTFNQDVYHLTNSSVDILSVAADQQLVENLNVAPMVSDATNLWSDSLSFSLTVLVWRFIIYLDQHDGSVSVLGSFVNQCQLMFDIHSIVFATDDIKINTIESLLTQKASKYCSMILQLEIPLKKC
ncbi:hypothetical protein MIR68_010800 [Amoeboaphelidium protococcarum]|nr:hypothetical protein MIR68_010800 [Amoeboaphelidium protococcarum]